MLPFSNMKIYFSPTRFLLSTRTLDPPFSSLLHELLCSDSFPRLFWFWFIVDNVHYLLSMANPLGTQPILALPLRARKSLPEYHCSYPFS
tara:strand:- start:305 stop:574 length:270 start_codon:yes stop_codon:yes gene_type:complete